MENFSTNHKMRNPLGETTLHFSDGYANRRKHRNREDVATHFGHIGERSSARRPIERRFFARTRTDACRMRRPFLKRTPHRGHRAALDSKTRSKTRLRQRAPRPIGPATSAFSPPPKNPARNCARRFCRVAAPFSKGKTRRGTAFRPRNTPGKP